VGCDSVSDTGLLYILRYWNDDSFTDFFTFRIGCYCIFLNTGIKIKGVFIQGRKLKGFCFVLQRLKTGEKLNAPIEWL